MDYIEKSFASSSEASKLLITLATAVIAFCAATVNLKPSDATLMTPTTVNHKAMLSGSWVLLLLSVAFGVWTQLAITDVLSKGTSETPANPWNSKITTPFKCQILSFATGLVALVIYCSMRLFGR